MAADRRRNMAPFVFYGALQTTKSKLISHATSGSAMAEGPREALVSRNPATTKHLT